MWPGMPLGDHQQYLPALCDILLVAASRPPQLLPSHPKAKFNTRDQWVENQYLGDSCHCQNMSVAQWLPQLAWFSSAAVMDAAASHCDAENLLWSWVCVTSHCSGPLQPAVLPTDTQFCNHKITESHNHGITQSYTHSMVWVGRGL